MESAIKQKQIEDLTAIHDGIENAVIGELLTAQWKMNILEGFYSFCGKVDLAKGENIEMLHSDAQSYYYLLLEVKQALDGAIDRLVDEDSKLNTVGWELKDAQSVKSPEPSSN